MTRFKDHFSARATSYARYRPLYPPALFEWLAGIVPQRWLAWDCGTGSGQAASALGAHFDLVVATDASIHQLAAATEAPSVAYLAMTAEQAALRDRSVSLVTVAQALHWFDTNRFFTEVQRVLVPNGVFAVWSYVLCEIDPAIDPIVREFYSETLAGFWPAERALVDDGYSSLSMPFLRMPTPSFAMEHQWPLHHFMGYLSTWSAVARLSAETGLDPLPDLRRRLLPLWGPASSARRIRWPLTLAVGTGA